MDSGVESALQLLNETMCVAKSGVTEWAVEVCRNGGGTAYTEIDAESVHYKANLCTELGKRAGPRLRELTPVVRGNKEAGFTQPRAHTFAWSCTKLELLLKQS